MVLKKHHIQGILEAGCDEAGRGCLAGPVFAAAVILPDWFEHPLLNDSKQVSEKNRILLREIIEKSAIAWSVACCSNEEIDKLNILKASIIAMHKALDKLKLEPQHILVDGNQFIKYLNISHSCIVKGDSNYASIAAASILAKTYRDEYMLSLHNEYPVYGWENNKGYPTTQHRQAIDLYGISKYHRRSFKLKEKQLTFSF
jgi:ribonuclease HII